MLEKAKTFVLVGAGVAVGAFVGVGSTSEADEPAQEADSRPGVRVDAARSMDRGRDLHFSGTVRARDRAAVAVTVPGRVIARPVQVGDHVRRGRVLARIDPTPFANQVDAHRASLAAVVARLEQLDRDVVRAQRLRDRGAAPDEAVEQASAGRDQVRAERDALRARLAESKRQLAETVVRAPFAGYVTQVHVHVGEYAQPGRAAVDLSGSDALEVELQLPENLRSVLSENQVVELHRPLAPSPGSLTGIVTSIGGAAGDRAQLFPVLIAVDGEALAAGTTVEVAIPAAPKERMTVPLSALADFGADQGFVYRVTENRAERVVVTIGELLGRRVAIEGELAEGDEVVIAGHAALVPGEPVEVLR